MKKNILIVILAIIVVLLLAFILLGKNNAAVEPTTVESTVSPVITEKPQQEAESRSSTAVAAETENINQNADEGQTTVVETDSVPELDMHGNPVSSETQIVSADSASHENETPTDWDD